MNALYTRRGRKYREQTPTDSSRIYSFWNSTDWTLPIFAIKLPWTGELCIKYLWFDKISIKLQFFIINVRGYENVSRAEIDILAMSKGLLYILDLKFEWKRWRGRKLSSNGRGCGWDEASVWRNDGEYRGNLMDYIYVTMYTTILWVLTWKRKHAGPIQYMMEFRVWPVHVTFTL